MVRQSIEKTESLSRLDPAAEAAQDRIRRALPDSRVTDLLAGSWLGHPVHPLVVQLPIGMWLASAALDMLPGQQRAARQLQLLGLGAVPLAVLAGLVEARGLDRPQRRTGALHVLANVAGSVCYAASYRARGRGRSGRGWALAGLALVSTGGTLGAHLSYAMGVGVGRWQRPGRPDEEQRGEPATGPRAAEPVGAAR